MNHPDNHQQTVFTTAIFDAKNPANFRGSSAAEQSAVRRQLSRVTAIEKMGEFREPYVLASG